MPPIGCLFTVAALELSRQTHRHINYLPAVMVMNGMDMAIEPADSMMERVPAEILQVEDRQRRQLLPAEFPETGCDQRKYGWRSPDPLSDGDRKNIQNMVPDGQRDGVANCRPSYLSVGLDLVALDPLPVLTVDIGNGERQHAREEERHRQDDRK